MVAFAAAVQFLLISPVFIRRPFTPMEVGRSTAFFPLVGLLLGGLLAAADLLLAGIFPVQVRSALVLALWIVLTGALHFDGLLDACDGLLGGGTPERRMQIMRDERTGAYAVAGGALILLTMFSAVNAIEQERWAALLLAPVLGRCGMTLSVVVFPYARAAGLGRDIKDQAGHVQAAAAMLTTLVMVGILTWQLQDLVAATAFVSAAIVWWLASGFVMRKIPGMTGDTYGAINMLVEAGVLLTFAAAR
ncbi:MAG: adenosylcobinamide-GDP ribazoletransferase [Chloroflexota bacterium]